MQVGALAPYERSLRDQSPLRLVAEDGRSLKLDVRRWLSDVDDGDRTVLARCEGPVLDVGCGPGRFVQAMAELGLPILGLDIADGAVALTRQRGGQALRRSVFDSIPAEGRWRRILLMDGNIGIGGDVTRLLMRVRNLLAPGGLLLVEASPEVEADRAGQMRFAPSGEPAGPCFGWAEVGLAPLIRHALRVGLLLDEVWTAHGRTFVALAR
jgi:SAM-dependent methyltransferase